MQSVKAGSSCENLKLVYLPPPPVASGTPARADAMSPVRNANASSTTTECATTVASYGPNVSLSDHSPEELLATVNIYYTPILIVFGCLGNLLSIFVFYSSKLRLQSTSVYLSALALSDTLFLLQLFPPWLDAVQFSMIFFIPGICYTIIYVSYVTCCLSTWIVVAFTVERLVAVLYPLQRSLICTVNRAKYIVLFLTCTVLMLNVPVLKFVSPSANCSIDTEYLEHAARFNIVDTAIAFTVPLGAIVLLNARIMVGVWKLERARQHLLKVERQPGPSRVRPTQPPGTRSQHRVTRMLLVVSSVFVVLNLPAYTMRILAYTKKTQQQGGHWAAFQQVASIFFNTNFGINFMLYCLSGQNFRRALCQTITCFRRRTIETTAVRSTSHPVRSISTSYASAGTEAIHTVAIPVGTTDRQLPVRRHRSEPVMKRWTFDNSRHRVQHEEIEMTTYSVGFTGAPQHDI